MAFTRAWNENLPDGDATQASDIDLVFQQLKQDIRERMNALVVDWTADPVIPKARPVWVRLFNTITDRGIAHDTETPLIWENHERNVDGFWTAGQPTRFVIPTGYDGAYLFSGQIAFAPNAAVGTQRWAILRVGGTTIYDSKFMPEPSTLDAVYVSIVALLPNLAAGNYVELVAYQNSGGQVLALAANGAHAPSGSATYLHAIKVA